MQIEHQDIGHLGRFIEGVQRLLDDFSEENRSTFMGASFSLELHFSLVSIPVINYQLSYVEVKRLRNDRSR